MKNKLSFIFVLLFLVSTHISPTFAISPYNKKLDPDPKISRQQMESQIYFFNEVLVEFGATSPDEVIRLWIKGDQTRNGVYKYAVSCDKLKQQFINKWGDPEKTFWIIGGSSPWFTKYDIISKTDLSPTEVQYVVQYQWATSAGPEAPTTEQLVLQKVNDKWCVSSVVQFDGYHSWR